MGINRPINGGSMKKKILVLDDSQFILTTVGDMLRNLNYDVTTVDNGKAACQKVESSRYDMIIADMNMPVMDGLQFTRQVKTYPNCKFVPIVMLSSEESDEKISMAKKIGVSTFLRKPLNEKQLKTILQVTLNKRSAPRIPVKLDVFYGEDDSGANYAASATCNMSTGGLFLETDNPPDLGTKLKLKVSLPDKDQPICCLARVAWINARISPIRSDHPSGMGVEFLSLEDELRLLSFLRNGAGKH